MTVFRKTLIASAIAAVTHAAYAIDVNYSISADQPMHEISPLIYGTNHNMDMTGQENFGFFRIGGNRMTGYNWENNWSNAGSDWQHSSDTYMVPTGVDGSIPGITLTHFVEQHASPNVRSMVTLQMAGYVVADGDGSVSPSETAPSDRWIPAYPRKNAPFDLTPDLNDNAVYMDELVNFLVDRFGRADEGGVLGYSLDNEPALWYHTHPYIHPEGVGAMELIERSTALASAVKDVDSSAEIYGPALFGFGAYLNLVEPADWDLYANDYHWYIDMYLDQMREASEAEGRRLLDVLDLHWYTEDTGDQRVINSGANSISDQKTRLQSTRTLWDADYVENSWIGQWFSADLPLIPRLKESVQQYYPDTKLAFTEYSFGGANQISGAVAQADALGIFGKYDVYAATAWLLESDSSYIASAFRLFRNYDGANSEFGDLSVDASLSDKENSSVYASVDSDTGDLHVIVLNKSLDESISGTFTIDSANSYDAADVYAITDQTTAIQAKGDFDISNNAFTYSVPAVSAYHLVLHKGQGGSHSSASSVSSAVSSSSSVVSSSSSVSSSSAVSSVGQSSSSQVSVSSSSSQSSSAGECGQMCDWYGNIQPLCENQTSGWGWENQDACIGVETCKAQWGEGGVVDSCGNVSSASSVSSVASSSSSVQSSVSSAVSSVSSSVSSAVSSASSASSANSGSVETSISISNDWGSGYCASLAVSNTGATVVKMDVTVAIEGTVSSAWNGEWSQSGNLLHVESNAWNSDIAPGQTNESFGFCANR